MADIITSDTGTIEIVGYDPNDAYSKGYGDQLHTGEVSTDTLKKNLYEFTERLEEVFSGLKSTVSSYQLDEIEFKVELSTSGGVRLIASVSGEAKGAITLKYKRKANE